MESDKLKSIIQQQAQKYEGSAYLDRIIFLVSQYAKTSIDEFALRHRISSSSFEDFQPLMKDIILMLPSAKREQVNEVIDALADYHNLIHSRWDKIEEEYSSEKQEFVSKMSELFHLDMENQGKPFFQITQVDWLSWIALPHKILGGRSPDQLFLEMHNKSLTDIEVSVTPLWDEGKEKEFYGKYEGRFTDKEDDYYQTMINAMKKHEYGKAFRNIVPIYKNHPKFFRVKFNYISLRMNYLLREKYVKKSLYSKVTLSELKKDIHFLEHDFWREVENLKKQQPDYPMRERNKNIEKDLAKDLQSLIKTLKGFL